jgi:O-antigen/teichoic acid export membrane protein
MQIEIDPNGTVELSWFDRTAIELFRRLPGAGKVGSSARSRLALTGSLWTMAGYGGSQLLRLGTQLLLARMLLGPQAFGLVALVSVFLSGLEMLSDLGVGTDVIQHPRGDDPLFINTAFLIQAGRGLILFGVAAALAYPFASFYHQPAVRWMIFVAAASVGLRGFASGSIWTMTRHVQISKLTGLTFGGDFAGFVASVVWALFSPTAWALVIGRVVSSAVYMVASHVVADHRASFAWDREAARDVLIFGGGMFLSSSTYFLSGEAERLVVGKFVTLAELGCFSLALALSWGPSKAIQQVVGQVFLPMVAKNVREDRSAAISDYSKVRRLVLLLSCILGCGCILFGPLAVRALLGPKYADAGWMLQLLGFRAALELFSSPTSSMLFADGVSRYAAIGNIAKLGFLSIGLAITFGRFGFRQAVWVLAMSQFANYLPQLWGLKRYFRSTAGTEARSFGIFLATNLLAFLLAYWIL